MSQPAERTGNRKKILAFVLAAGLAGFAGYAGGVGSRIEASVGLNRAFNKDEAEREKVKGLVAEGKMATDVRLPSPSP